MSKLKTEQEKKAKAEARGKIKKFFGNIGRRASSRKFIVLALGVAMHIRDAKGFTGDHLVWVFTVFIIGNVAQKWLVSRKSINRNGEDYVD